MTPPIGPRVDSRPFHPRTERAPKMVNPAAVPAADPANKDLRSTAMKELFARVVEQQRRLGFSDARLCEFATETLKPLDPYRKFKATSVDFLSRLRVLQMKQLLKALEKATG